jgi:hypothetical protein
MKPAWLSQSPAVLLSVLALAVAGVAGSWPPAGWDTLPVLTPGQTKAENALWIENPLTARFNTTNRVVVADLKGPAVITMIHFALPQSHFAQPPELLNRDLLLRMFWEGERSPSVEVPLVDFFCDPAGLREEVNTALVNKRRGYNAYFPMPFQRQARIELLYAGTVPPGEELWRRMPCYSYVMYRTLAKVPRATGRFHASWRQEALLLGQRDYTALEATGPGKFVGWNVTMRLPGRDGYPVDQNEKFYVDGEATPSIEFQGIEDSFGFSWGFPATESQFPLTGYYKFFKGAMGYRFFLQDAISFRKSLRVTIGFGANEDPMFRREFSRRGNAMQLSSTVYWYQTEPHAPLPAMPGTAERAPAPEQRFWPEVERLPTDTELRQRGVKLHMLCGRTGKEVVFAEPAYGAVVKQGYCFEGWSPPVYHCRADNQELQIEVTVPRNATGKLRLFMIDPDRFEGGRRQTVRVAGADLGEVADFVEGRWLEKALGPDETREGNVLIQARNARNGSNAVVSIVEWVE